MKKGQKVMIKRDGKHYGKFGFVVGEQGDYVLVAIYDGGELITVKQDEVVKMI